MKIKHMIDKVLEYVLILFMAALVVDVLWQVLSRYLLQSPSNFTDELARFLLIWVGMLGAAYGTGQKLHLAIDVLINRFKPGYRRTVDILIFISIAVFALLVMVIGGFNLIAILLKSGNISAALSMPIGYVYSVIPLSGLIIMYYSIHEIIFYDTESGKKTVLDLQVD